MRYYFIKRGVPQISELPNIGAFGSSFISKKHINYKVKDVYNANKEAKYIVSFTFFSPTIVICDLDLIKTVLVKSFDNFAYHKTFVDETNDPLIGKNLAFLNGDKWREVRNLLTPVFTSSKMRAMHTLMTQCAENFTDTFVKLHANVDAIDIKDVFSRFTTDVIATCAFGIEVNSLDNPNDEFYVTGKKCSFGNRKILLKFFFHAMFPKLSAALGMRIIPKEETDFFVNVIKTTIKTREERGISRPDILQLMIDAKGKKSDYDLIEITAQAFIFFLGGFDTTSDAMCLIAHELAANPDIQQKLQLEIDAVMKECNGKLTYEAVANMNYLDAIFNETMRLHPLAFLSRVCSKDFEFPPVLPDSKPTVIKAGTEIVIPVAAIHRNPDYYENPDKFNPDRYLNKKITSDIMNLSFGLGPRMCIGNRFAILEIKTLFVYMTQKCSLEPCKDTCIPLVYNPDKFPPTAKGGFWLRIKRRH